MTSHISFAHKLLYHSVHHLACHVIPICAITKESSIYHWKDQVSSADNHGKSRAARRSYFPSEHYSVLLMPCRYSKQRCVHTRGSKVVSCELSPPWDDVSRPWWLTIRSSRNNLCWRKPIAQTIVSRLSGAILYTCCMYVIYTLVDWSLCGMQNGRKYNTRHTN